MPRVAEHNTSIRAHHVSLLSRWSTVPGSTIHKTLLERVTFITQALALTYSFFTNFYFDQHYKESVHKVVIQLLEVVVWQLPSASCSDGLVQGLRCFSNSPCQIWCASTGNFFPRSFQLLLCIVSTCPFLLEVRLLALQGKRKRPHAQETSKALLFLIKQSINRPAGLADECQGKRFLNFLQVQLVAIFGDANMGHEVMIYLVLQDTESYAGRGNMVSANWNWGAGLVYRGRSPSSSMVSFCMTLCPHKAKSTSLQPLPVALTSESPDDRC